MTRIFLSYAFANEIWVQRVSFYLSKQPGLESYCYADQRCLDSWQSLLLEKISACSVFVFFVGPALGTTQQLEADAAAIQTLSKLAVKLPGSAQLPESFSSLLATDVFHVSDAACPMTPASDRAAYRCAKEIAKRLHQPWIAYDGLPMGYLFDYEKRVVDFYVNLGTAERETDESRDYLELGCPPGWPNVKKYHSAPEFENPVPEKVIGKLEVEGTRIYVDAREKQLGRTVLTLTEARPQKHLCRPRQDSLTAAILVSGGIAPGINAVIASIVERHHLYHHWQKRQGKEYELSVIGFRDGITGLLRHPPSYERLGLEDVRRYSNVGGSMLGTSRSGKLSANADPSRRSQHLVEVVRAILTEGIDILYVIGGDGSMRAAHAIWTTYRSLREDGDEAAKDHDLSIVAVPKTMDNDILWVWQAFGFPSAVETAKEFLQHLRTEVRSNPRLCVAQLFGSDSGFVVGHAALASGVCDYALVPEVVFTMDAVRQRMRKCLRKRYKAGIDGRSPYGLVVMAETAIPTDWRNYAGQGTGELAAEQDEDARKFMLTQAEIDAIEKFERDGRRVFGQTPDALRSGGLKIVSGALQQEINHMATTVDYWKTFRVFTSEPRHLIRAISPSASDVIFAQRLGNLAVDNAMAGYTDCMVSQWLTEYVLVPLDLVVLGRKRVWRDGIFWKSVLAATGQEGSL